MLLRQCRALHSNAHCIFSFRFGIAFGAPLSTNDSFNFGSSQHYLDYIAVFKFSINIVTFTRLLNLQMSSSSKLMERYTHLYFTGSYIQLLLVSREEPEEPEWLVQFGCASNPFSADRYSNKRFLRKQLVLFYILFCLILISVDLTVLKAAIITIEN